MQILNNIVDFLTDYLRFGGYIISAIFVLAVVAAIGSVFYPYEAQARAYIARRNPGGASVAERITDIYRANYFDYGSLNLGYRVSSVQITSSDPGTDTLDFVYPYISTPTEGLYVTVTVQFYSLFLFPREQGVVSCAL